MIVSPALYLTVNIASNISLERERGGRGGGGGKREKEEAHNCENKKKITKNLLSFSSKCEKSIFLAIAFSSAEVVL